MQPDGVKIRDWRWGVLVLVDRGVGHHAAGGDIEPSPGCYDKSIGGLSIGNLLRSSADDDIAFGIVSCFVLCFALRPARERKRGCAVRLRVRGLERERRAAFDDRAVVRERHYVRGNRLQVEIRFDSRHVAADAGHGADRHDAGRNTVAQDMVVTASAGTDFIICIRHGKGAFGGCCKSLFEFCAGEPEHNVSNVSGVFIQYNIQTQQYQVHLFFLSCPAAFVRKLPEAALFRPLFMSMKNVLSAIFTL